MAVDFDAAVESTRTGTTDPHTWTHTPTGTPRAIVVAAIHGVTATSHVTAVTYGGVAMSKVVDGKDTATEPGTADLWFLGASIPTGNQTVSADLDSATGDDIEFVSMSFTANDDCEVVDFDEINENAANPSVTLQYGGRTCMAVAALYGGGAAPSSFTPNANCETVHDHDLGAFYAEVIRQSTAGTADFTIGGTASSDDVGFAALAVSEVQPVTGTGALTVPAPTIAASGVLEFSGTGAPTVLQPTIAGSGSVVTGITGTGDLSVLQPTVAATATQGFTGTASLVVPQPVVAAQGAEEFSGTATPTVPQPTIAAEGINLSPVTGDAALSVPVVGISGSGSVTIPDSGEILGGGGGIVRREWVDKFLPKKKRKRIRLRPLRVGNVEIAVTQPVVDSRGVVTNPPPIAVRGESRVPSPESRGLGTVWTLAETLDDRMDTMLVLLALGDDDGAD